MDREADQLAKLVAGADQPRKFDEAAKTLGLTPFPVQVLENEPAQYNGKVVPSVSAWAFGGAKIGETSDLFDAEDGYYVARLDSLSEGGKTFDAVKPAVRGRVAEDRAIERSIPAAQGLAKAAKSSSLEAAAAAAKMTVQQDRHGDPRRRRKGDRQPARGGWRCVRAAAQRSELAHSASRTACSCTRTDARKPSDKATFEAQKTELRARRLQQMRDQWIQMYLDDLKKSATIKDQRKELNAQLRRQSAT